MASPTYKDIVAEGLGRLITQWKDKPKIVGYLTSLLENVQVVEDLYQQLLNERSIYTAIGVQLDVIGLIVGVARNGLPDEEYRQRLFAQISFNTADSTPEKVLEIGRLLTGTDETNIFEHFPASTHVYLKDGVENSTSLINDAAHGAGIHSRVMTDQGGGSFIGAESESIESDLVTNNQDNLEDDLGNLFEVTDSIETAFGQNSWLPEFDDPEETNFLCDVLPNKLYIFQTGNLQDNNENNFITGDGDFLQYQILEETASVTTI
jgi:hypothetical protein